MASSGQDLMTTNDECKKLNKSSSSSEEIGGRDDKETKKQTAGCGDDEHHRHPHLNKHQMGQSTMVGFSKNEETNRTLIHEENVHNVFLPWSVLYKTWWGFTVVAAIFTIFFETYQIGFLSAGLAPYNDGTSIVEYLLVSIFVVDILVNFNLAFFDDCDVICCNRRDIAKHYVRDTMMFAVDIVGIFPFYTIALAIAGELGNDSQLAQYLSLLRLLRMVRLHRVRQFFAILQYTTKISLLGLTLTRNFAFALVWTHFAACVFYFIARQYEFDDDQTWIGQQVHGLNGFERYTTTLYFSVVTFTTVGYGDYSPANPAEQIWGMIFMLLNIIFQSWIIGSITLLIVKSDEKTGHYRDTLQTLNQYSNLHDFDDSFHKRLKKQVQLDFNNREIADEQVLTNFPSSVRRKVLRKLYLKQLIQTNLMQGVRQHFVDAFLTACVVEMFSPGEDILQRGSISSDLYLLVEGTVKLQPLGSGTVPSDEEQEHGGAGTSIADSESLHGAAHPKEMNEGDFINDIGFFTESPQIDTVRTVTVCKTLTMSRVAYKMITEDHPGSAGQILQNLLHKVEQLARDLGRPPKAALPKPLEVLRAGSVFDPDPSGRSVTNRGPEEEDECAMHTNAALTAVQDLIKMHISKQLDDQTTRFLFAASRGDHATISLMCEQGSFDPNNADYDSRTALMVAAMKGNTDVVRKLLEYGANPNLVDMHGSTALYEAAKNGHENTMQELLKNNAELCMSESQASSTLCQVVFEGDLLTLKRLLQAKLDPNAADYDKRTAAHIAAAEGNAAALKVLQEFGANMQAQDRWGNTIQDEQANHLRKISSAPAVSD